MTTTSEISTEPVLHAATGSPKPLYIGARQAAVIHHEKLDNVEGGQKQHIKEEEAAAPGRNQKPAVKAVRHPVHLDGPKRHPKSQTDIVWRGAIWKDTGLIVMIRKPVGDHHVKAEKDLFEQIDANAKIGTQIGGLLIPLGAGIEASGSDQVHFLVLSRVRWKFHKAKHRAAVRVGIPGSSVSGKIEVRAGERDVCRLLGAPLANGRCHWIGSRMIGKLKTRDALRSIARIQFNVWILDGTF